MNRKTAAAVLAVMLQFSAISANSLSVSAEENRQTEKTAVQTAQTTIQTAATTAQTTQTTTQSAATTTQTTQTASTSVPITDIKKTSDLRLRARNEQNVITVTDLNVSTISVSCLKVTWKSEKDREYDITCESLDSDDLYTNNINLELKSEDLCYITGLRENTEYIITVRPVLKTGEKKNIKEVSETAKTEQVEVIEEFPYQEGWTNCFAGERASGLTAMPSSGAIYGAEADVITDTGIMRDEYGDYCCAMGVAYGYCNDRFLVELENGIQFTVKICDSKGWGDDDSGIYHWFGGEGNGKCIIEFIYDSKQLPSCVAVSGSWGYWNWNGLNLGANIRSIKKINYGDTIEY